MSSPAAQTQWYIARDGQQFGPLSDTELTKFVELGHLQPTDLLWREGFPDWRPAMVVFPPRKPAMQRPAPTPRAPVQWLSMPLPHAGPASSDGASGANAESRGRPAEPSAARELPRTGGDRAPPQGPEARPGGHRSALPPSVRAAGTLPRHSDKLLQLMNTLVARLPVGLLEQAPGKDAAGGKELATSPLQGFRAAPDALDPTLQATPLWRVLKRDYPDWYAARLQEIAALAAENKDDAAIGQQMARALVALRRKEVSNALSAGFPQLKAVASTFYENLVLLRKHSSEACFEFISQGEASPSSFP